jgi:phosphoribosylformylglycinamidine synthase subunit PurS
LRVKVFITPRKGILDPQGRTVAGALQSLGFTGVAGVHVGRYILIDINASSAAEAEAAVKQMCDRLLANPNIEDYRCEVDSSVEPSREASVIPASDSGRTVSKDHE